MTTNRQIVPKFLEAYRNPPTAESVRIFKAGGRDQRTAELVESGRSRTKKDDPWVKADYLGPKQTILRVEPDIRITKFSDGNSLFIHGGLSSDGQKMNDLYKINLKTFRSKKCQIEDGSLTRAMHKMVTFENNIFLFGGLTETDSISDNLYKLSPIEGSNRH